MAQCPFYHAVSSRMASILFQDVFRKRAAIDADADGNTRWSYFFYDPDYVLIRTDIARVDPQGLYSAVYRQKCQLIVKVDVGYQGHGRCRNDIFQSQRRRFIRYGKADDFCSQTGKTLYVCNSPAGIGRIDSRHGLHRNRRRTADRHCSQRHGP